LDVIRHILELMEEHGWTEYRLAKKSGLPPSTVANIFHRNTVPGISTLETICDAFGISLSQFFSEGDFVSLTPEQADLLKRWSSLSSSQKDAVLHVMSEMGKQV
jgi:transcriptional regulator with XRE-family HTH domain